ncbi:hypothetical protein BJ944DRAFT_247863 [Cunninghamella echinulata]|nr:hypothetical protein BJ944DRAFT_247863 [Cunninghamella echinulata]
MKSPTLIKRYLKTYKVPLANTQWLTPFYLKHSQHRNIILEDQAALQPITDSTITKKYTELIPDAFKTPNGMDQNSIEHHTNFDSLFINIGYSCYRPTKLDLIYIEKIVAYLSLLKKSRELESNDQSTLAYPHAISALKAIN